MKITLIGVGSFVFGPSAIYDAIVAHDIPALELALVDNNRQVAELMAGIARRMATDFDRDVTISVHTGWREALEGSDFVCMSAAVDLIGRFQRDSEMIRSIYPSHVLTEFGGVAGISYTVRQIELIRALTADMKELCPDALLLMSSNPLARVSEAAQTSGIRTVGFCSNSMKGYGLVGRLLQGWDEEFPWPRAMERYEATMAGANHFTFLVALQDRETGDNVLPAFMETAIRNARDLEPTTRDLLASTGLLSTNGDDHIRDFLPPTEVTESLVHNAHGGPQERARRLQLLADIGASLAPVDELIAHRAWERPIAFAAAYAGIADSYFHSVNLPNTGQLVGIHEGPFVETPADVSKGIIRPRQVTLPAPVRDLTEQTVSLSSLIVQAILARDSTALFACLSLDPTVLDNKLAEQALRACLQANADIVGIW